MSVPRSADQPWGLIQVFTGGGKGKTTAALGTALRAVAQGKKVGLIYFDKGGAHYSERELLARRFPEIKIAATGLDRIDPKTGRFRFGVLPEDRVEADRGLTLAKKWIGGGQFDLVILDEINSTISLGMLELEPVLDLLRARPKNVEVICTGRQMPEALGELADLVTEMNLIKHYFYQGQPARLGLDY